MCYIVYDEVMRKQLVSKRNCVYRCHDSEGGPPNENTNVHRHAGFLTFGGVCIPL